ncbi:aldehyde dehydrogenase family protein [Paraburkholderia sp. MM6662-R1]|uniref:aldehyde dehydrogenase family protein n=1 Tax=Paraburkholderia sp. MM6662-R1 TaxID=2991066 RepID=UPI003D1BE0A1
MKNVSMLIGGEQTQARNGASFERRSPLDGEVATRAPAATVEDAVAAVDAAAAAFPVWSALGPSERRALLTKAAHALEAKADAFAAAMAAETGASGIWAGFNVHLSLDRVTPDMRIYHDESFGPVKPIVRVRGEEAAIACANDNEYGLSAAVFSRDTARALNVAKRIESGICHVNGPTVHDEAQMPFGGVKASGFGRFGGKAGIAEFTDLRWVTLQTTPRHYPF